MDIYQLIYQCLLQKNKHLILLQKEVLQVLFLHHFYFQLFFEYIHLYLLYIFHYIFQLYISYPHILLNHQNMDLSKYSLGIYLHIFFCKNMGNYSYYIDEFQEMYIHMKQFLLFYLFQTLLHIYIFQIQDLNYLVQFLQDNKIYNKYH